MLVVPVTTLWSLILQISRPVAAQYQRTEKVPSFWMIFDHSGDKFLGNTMFEVTSKYEIYMIFDKLIPHDNFLNFLLTFQKHKFIV